MTDVRSTAHAGWVEVTGTDLVAVVEVADRHAGALVDAASTGFVDLLDILCSRGLHVLPPFALVVRTDDGVRAFLRGAGRLHLADGTVLESLDRLPWREVELDAETAGDVVTVGGPEPTVARGWRRPARLRGAAVVPPCRGGAGVHRARGLRPEPEPSEPEPEPEPASPSREPEPEPERARCRGSRPPGRGRGTDAGDRRPAGRPHPPAAGGLRRPGPGRARARRHRPRTGASSTPCRGGGPAAPPRTRRPRCRSRPSREGPRGSPARSRPRPSPSLPNRPQPSPSRARAAADVPTRPTARRGARRRRHDRRAATSRGPTRTSTARSSSPCSARPATTRPPHAGRCRTCGREIPPQQPTPIPRPPLGVLRISTGGVVPLDRGVLLGRSPRVNEELAPNQRPHLIRVGGVDRDISRNHAEVVLEGWHVLVRDLGSTNGTTVALPGEEPVRLRPTEDQGIEPGTVITLADEVSLTYEVEG